MALITLSWFFDPKISIKAPAHLSTRAALDRSYKERTMSSRPSTVPKPAVVLPKRTPVLIQPDSDQLFTNRIVGVATIVVYTSAVFIAGYLTGM